MQYLNDFIKTTCCLQPNIFMMNKRKKKLDYDIIGCYFLTSYIFEEEWSAAKVDTFWIHLFVNKQLWILWTIL